MDGSWDRIYLVKATDGSVGIQMYPQAEEASFDVETVIKIANSKA
jgi:hypothetical protein